ncbi:TIGR03862 family flavoprotein [Amylibacter sp.]|nr:TIGR03862 family flavoprotein [Amylibacter sp.]
MFDVCIIGGGPAGLMAAETAADNGLSVVIIDAKPTYGRKFLMAGKSGLNITKDEAKSEFLNHYFNAKKWLAPIINNFDNEAVMKWAKDLDQEIFTGSSGRVFPKSMKASPLLRSWLIRLSHKGVTFYRNWKWVGWQGDIAAFETISGKKLVKSHATILAMGGASWPHLGSDGLWADILKKNNVNVTNFQPSNMGFKIQWSKYMKPFFGSPIKSVRITSGKFSTVGEFVISKKGIEGSGIYAASKFMRDGNNLIIDLLPDTEIETLNKRHKHLSPKVSRSTFNRKVLRLNNEKTAFFNEFSQHISTQDITHSAKSLLIPHEGPHPINEAISTAGGVSKSALNDNLMLKAIPSVFCAGEMLDWEAPTGGYLITACLATGKWAGLGAVNYIKSLK